MFTFTISGLTISNLPWFMHLTFQVPMQYCSIQHWTLLSPPDASTAGHYFHFGPASSLSGSSSPFFRSSILDTYWPGAHFPVSYIFVFSYRSGGSQGKNTEMVCHSLIQWTMFCQNSPPWPVCLGWLCIAVITKNGKEEEKQLNIYFIGSLYVFKNVWKCVMFSKCKVDGTAYKYLLLPQGLKFFWDNLIGPSLTLSSLYFPVCWIVVLKKLILIGG